MGKLATLAVVAVLVFAVASPAFATTAPIGNGRDFGEHHAEHAVDMGGFTGTMNPGVGYQGFSGWKGMLPLSRHWFDSRCPSPRGAGIFVPSGGCRAKRALRVVAGSTGVCARFGNSGSAGPDAGRRSSCGDGGGHRSWQLF